MNNEIKIVHELRPCKYRTGNVENGKIVEINALFHMFDTDGNAMIEVESGQMMNVNGNNIRFIDGKFMNYCFDDPLNPKGGLSHE